MSASQSPAFVCPSCGEHLWFAYTSNRTGNIRHCVCRKKNCDSQWLAVWKGKPMRYCFNEPRHTKMTDWSWTRAGSVLAVCLEEELSWLPDGPQGEPGVPENTVLVTEERGQQ